MVPYLVTLNDPNFNGTPLFDVDYPRNGSLQNTVTIVINGVLFRMTLSIVSQSVERLTGHGS